MEFDMVDDDNTYFKNVYHTMDVSDLNRLSKLSNDEGKALIEIELRKREAVVAIKDILKKFDFEISDLTDELIDPKIREIIEGRYVPPVKIREETVPRYLLNGKTYDGRQARRAKEFSRYVKDGRIDVALVVEEGAFNPEWLNDQKPRVLFSLGIVDKKAYVLKHNLQLPEKD